MKKISKEIFDPYVIEPNSAHKAIEKPFLWKEYVAATDTRFLLMIRKDLLEDNDYEAQGGTPDIKNALSPENCDLCISADLIKITIGELPQCVENKLVLPKIICKECGGSGEVDWEYVDKDGKTHYGDHDCPCCYGTGVIRPAKYEPTGRTIPTPDSLIILDGACIAGMAFQRLLDTLNALSIDNVRLISFYKDKACKIRLKDGIDFIFMPSSPERKEDFPHTYLNLKK